MMRLPHTYNDALSRATAHCVRLHAIRTLRHMDGGIAAKRMYKMTITE